MTEMWIIRIISFLMGWFFLSYLKKCCQLLNTKETLEILEGRYEFELTKNRYYKNELHQMKVLSNQRKKYSDSVKEAVHYAMQKSHPDNGGKQEDFIKFQKLYKSME